MILFTGLTPGGAYTTHVLPGLLIIGVGMGCIFAPAIGTATLGVDVNETGVACAMVNTSQQIGGSVGLALLSTLSASAAAHYAQAHSRLPALAGWYRASPDSFHAPAAPVTAGSRASRRLLYWSSRVPGTRGDRIDDAAA